MKLRVREHTPEPGSDPEPVSCRQDTAPAPCPQEAATLPLPSLHPRQDSNDHRLAVPAASLGPSMQGVLCRQPGNKARAYLSLRLPLPDAREEETIPA